MADYHTTPTDCVGNIIGGISHAGTGYVDLLVTAVEMPDYKKVVFIGPVMSYHEYRSTNFLRLTDEEWQESFFEKSYRPEWVNVYLADHLGKTKSSLFILASSKDEMELFLNSSYNPVTSNIFNSPDINPFILFNSPKPFSSNTIISYTIPEVLRNSFTRLCIYNIQGREINVLVNEHLPPGNYVTDWHRNNSSGQIVPPGIYLARIMVGKSVQTHKILVSE